MAEEMEAAPEGQAVAVIKVPMALLEQATEALTQLTTLLNAAKEKAGSDIAGQEEEESAGAPPPVSGSSLSGMGAELDAMRRSRG